MQDTWTVFLAEQWIEKNNKMQWVKHLAFYWGDAIAKAIRAGELDISTDWRFKAVDGKRKQDVLLGVTQTKFPIAYPLEIDGGDTVFYGEWDWSK